MKIGLILILFIFRWPHSFSFVIKDLSTILFSRGSLRLEFFIYFQVAT